VDAAEALGEQVVADDLADLDAQAGELLARAGGQDLGVELARRGVDQAARDAGRVGGRQRLGGDRQGLAGGIDGEDLHLEVRRGRGFGEVLRQRPTDRVDGGERVRGVGEDEQHARLGGGAGGQSCQSAVEAGGGDDPADALGPGRRVVARPGVGQHAEGQSPRLGDAGQGAGDGAEVARLGVAGQLEHEGLQLLGQQLRESIRSERACGCDDEERAAALKESLDVRGEAQGRHGRHYARTGSASVCLGAAVRTPY
jgi:hypothetical protein